MNEKPLPCPGCGNDDIAQTKTGKFLGRIQCICGWEGPETDITDEFKTAIECWNKRIIDYQYMVMWQRLKMVFMGNHSKYTGIEISELIVQDEIKFLKDLINLDRKEQSTLLYLESCATDFGGMVDSDRMNGDDFEAIKKFIEKNLIKKFERLPMASVDYFQKDGRRSQRHDHWVELTDYGWMIAHTYRRLRSFRMQEKNRMYTRKG